MSAMGLFIALVALFQVYPSDTENRKMWVYFVDKSDAVCMKDKVRCHLLPPDEAHLLDLESNGIKVVNTSHWLNAVSVIADSAEIELLRNLDYVASIQPVQSLSTARTSLSSELVPSFDDIVREYRSHQHPASLNSYGQSAAQLQFHRIDKVHELGYDGTGIIVGIMDGGFDVNHEAFEHLRSSDRILAERDFVDGGNNTRVNVIDPLYHSHGTSVAAIIAGLKDGTLMGVSPGASLVLARTEDDKQEAPIEEDNWVAAIEWMQTLGVQVVSSSLGYNIFTSQPSASYTYDDMDGKTSAIARAATKAASVFNMVVVTSAGNEGNGSWKYINTPADADSILAVGSLTSSGLKALSSSFGPSSDGRIKPDVSARGQCVFTARSDSQTSKYTSCISGTSFAAPHVAGMIALALQARPGMPAIWYVRQAHKASSLYSNPNNEIGYGKIDALDLITGVTTSIQEDAVPNLPEDAFVVQNFPNPFNPSTTLYFDVPTGWNLSGVTVIDVTGRSVATIPTATSTSSGTLQWNGYNTAGIRVASGIYFAQFEFKNGAASKILVHPMSLIK